MFSGIIADQMPDESAWAIAYSQDIVCSTIIKMIINKVKLPTTTSVKSMQFTECQFGNHK
jgi:hypothetical protein